MYINMILQELGDLYLTVANVRICQVVSKYGRLLINNSRYEIVMCSVVVGLSECISVRKVIVIPISVYTARK